MRAQVSGKVGLKKHPALAGFCGRDFSRARLLEQGDAVHVQKTGGFFDVENAVPHATAIEGQSAGSWLLNSGIVWLAHGTHLFGGAVP